MIIPPIEVTADSSIPVMRGITWTSVGTEEPPYGKKEEDNFLDPMYPKSARS